MILQVLHHKFAPHEREINLPCEIPIGMKTQIESWMCSKTNSVVFHFLHHKFIVKHFFLAIASRFRCLIGSQDFTSSPMLYDSAQLPLPFVMQKPKPTCYLVAPFA